MFRRAVILLGALLLSGCGMWSGPAFYPIDKNYSWLPPGTYRAQTEGKIQYGRWNGKAFFELPSGKRQKRDKTVVTMVALAGTKLDASIAQISAGYGKDGAVFALVVRDRNTWTYAFPDCATTKRIVTGAGGIIDGPAELRVETTTEPVSFADMETYGVSLSDGHGTKHHNRHRRTLRSKRPPSAQKEPMKSVEAPPAGRDDEHGSLACHFPTRDSLEAAARRYLAERQLIGDKVTRVGD